MFPSARMREVLYSFHEFTFLSVRVSKVEPIVSHKALGHFWQKSFELCEDLAARATGLSSAVAGPTSGDHPPALQWQTRTALSQSGAMKSRHPDCRFAIWFRRFIRFATPYELQVPLAFSDFLHTGVAWLSRSKTTVSSETFALPP